MTAHKPDKLVVFEHLQINDITVDPTHIAELEIFESLVFPGITGKITLQDWENYKETRNPFAGDNVYIHFGRDGDEPLKLRFKIYESDFDSPPPDSLYNLVSLKFCSPWIIDGFVKKDSLVWSNKRIDEIVRELVESCGGVINENYWSTDTQLLERFVSPYWTPCAIIKHLQSFVMTEEGHSGFCLWTEIEPPEDADDGQVCFMPISKLMKSPEKSEESTLSFDATYGAADIELRQNPADPKNTNRMQHMMITTDYDILRYGDAGAARSKFVGFDFDGGKVMQLDQKIDQYEHLKDKHLMQKMQLNDKFLRSAYKTTKNTTLYPNTNSLIETEEEAKKLLKGKLHAKHAFLYSDSIKLNGLTTGEGRQKRVGKLIRVRYPNLTDGGTGAHGHYTGWYLLRNINHRISGMLYNNVVTLITDGVGRDADSVERADMINWDGENNDNDFTDEPLKTFMQDEVYRKCVEDYGRL